MVMVAGFQAIAPMPMPPDAAPAKAMPRPSALAPLRSEKELAEAAPATRRAATETVAAAV